MTEPLQATDFDALLSAAIDAAYDAGRFIRSWNRDGLRVMEKEGGLSLASKVVTEVDIQGQALILENLKPTFSKYDLGLLAEEGRDEGDRFSKARFWCIDPLDGTLPFIEHGKGYAVSIALVSKEGIPEIGVVYDPFHDVMYSAIRGKCAMKNGERFQVREKFDMRPSLTVFFDKSFTVHPRFEQTSAALRLAAPSFGCDDVIVKVERGAVLNGCGVVDSAPACYFKYPRKEPSGGSLWDFAASACIAAEAGAWVTDIFGNLLDLNREDSTFMNHRGVLYASHSVIAEWVRDIFNGSSGKI